VSARLDTFTVCQPGVEPITAAELARLGVIAKPTHGGLTASMTWAQLALAHLHLRTATRLLVRVGRFDATTFGQFAAGMRRVDWGHWLIPDVPIDVKVATARSRLYHSAALAERVRDALPGHGTADPAEETQAVLVRVDRDHVTISLDATGDALHRRGWRTEAGPAPMRETLAAALVLWSGWDGRTPLVDPCCGAGTIAIEAAMSARRMPPGAGRDFSWQRWPGAQRVDWARLVAAAQADVRERAAPVLAADVDARAVEMAQRNAERAGVRLDAAVTSVDSLTRPSRPGWVVTNPPYGTRLRTDLRSLYGALGRCAAPPWHLAVVAAVGAPTTAFGRVWVATLSTRNGGLPVRFLRA
jgi:putative N6-adenine-specific DNA methylase